MMAHMPARSTLRTAALAAVLAAALAAPGCTEPFTAYHAAVGQSSVADSGTILVMPFMDTRTFVGKNDPRKMDLGVHARTIFVNAMRDSDAGAGAVIITPSIPQPMKSLTNAEIAEIGRRYGADAVIAGQVFSFTGTRAASIPPRAGMFVRAVSAHDGSLLFVGDHYQSASIPGAPGGRELQAQNVSERLVEGLLSKVRPAASIARGIASSAAMAMIAPVPAALPIMPWRENAFGNNMDGRPAREKDPLPDPAPSPVFPGLTGLTGGDAFDMAEWDALMIPEAPPLLDSGEDARSLAAPDPASTPDALAGESPEPDEENEPEPQPRPEQAAAPEPEPRETPAIDAVLSEGEPEETGTYLVDFVDTAAAAIVEELSEIDFRTVNPNMVSVDAPPPVIAAARLSGDELAEDLFAGNGDAGNADGAAPRDREQPSVDEFGDGVVELDPETLEVRVTADAAGGSPAEAPAASLSGGESAARARPATRPSFHAGDNGPVVSVPLGVEQPHTFKSVNREVQELPEDPDAAEQGGAASVAVPERGGEGGIRVLMLPYHDLPNENNLIPNTGGGEVVTTLFGTQLAMDSGITLMWDGSGQATHDRLVGREEAILMGRQAGADYVMRGQVIEFRRAQSVPSFYSAMISTAVLAAQIFFAEMSGVDVATEVYRVSDGLCVMSRRDRSQQKYVVQAEKTVRRMAGALSESVGAVIREQNPESMDPLIDDLSPATLLTKAQ